MTRRALMHAALAAHAALALLGACAAGSRAVSSVRSAAPPAGASRARNVASAAVETRFVDSVLATLTLAEKLGQLDQRTAQDYAAQPESLGALIARGGVGSLMDVIGADTARALQRIAVERSPARIPLLFADDVIHGFRTIFPIPLGEASSWDPGLAERTARAAAIEASANGIAWTYAPMVDIARDARWGRIMEGAGEEPFLGAAFAAARVRGFQGHDLRAPGAIAATAKHFAAYGAAEGGRDYANGNVDERTLRDVYLPPFRAALCAGAQSVMAAFNTIGGVPSHANARLLRGVLRDEWGFDGLVVSDWNGVGELLAHRVAADRAAAGALALRAGVDVDMVSGIYSGEMARAVATDAALGRAVDEAVRRVLRLKYRLGLFAAPDHGAAVPNDAAKAPTTATRTLAREAARASIVLLENRGALLPLRRDLPAIAVLGALATDSAAATGAWAARAREADAVTMLEGIRRAVAPATTVLYARGASPTSDDTSGIAEAVRTARRAAVAIVVIGETRDMTGEASSRASLEVPGAQRQMVEAVAATGVPVVAVLMNGRPLSLGWLRDRVPAVVETWFGGTEAGTAAADVLFGAVNPGGRLPVTFPRSVGQVPIYAAHLATGRPPLAENAFTSKYLDLPWTPLYPLGYGLSYTTFTSSAPRTSAATMHPGETIDVAVDVANTGTAAGDAVVQLYVRDDVASVARPVAELRGFVRVTLAPRETRTVHFTLGVEALAFHDTSMRRVAEPGTFTLLAGVDVEHLAEARVVFATGDGRAVEVPERCEGAGVAGR